MKFHAVGKLDFPFPLFPRQEQAHFIQNGTSLRRSGTWTFFSGQGSGHGPCILALLGKPDLGVWRADWTSHHSHSHSSTAPLTTTPQTF